ncbi:helix-turn-helix domain-containing protein [Fodinicurvata fenggangensis]|uniref:helix-turn-helix domain-containing protein n=1 Tax=Fodinicurvata fenggangensis TaxID=1121830 RepID=UPI00068E7EE1|nr:XRE family transcriptional regulator [Fodinicurvata fenggangensis]
MSKSEKRDPVQEAVGAEIRALRKTRGLTLPDMGKRMGRSVGFLSQVERGLSRMTLQDLRDLAQVLDVPLSWFFQHEDIPDEERGYVVRRSYRRTLGVEEKGLVEQLLSPDLSGSFEVILSTMNPGAELEQATLRKTEEVGYVVSGQIEIWIGDNHFKLASGDSFQIRMEPFRWRNMAREPAVIVWVISPPIY